MELALAIFFGSYISVLLLLLTPKEGGGPHNVCCMWHHSNLPNRYRSLIANFKVYTYKIATYSPHHIYMLIKNDRMQILKNNIPNQPLLRAEDKWPQVFWSNVCITNTISYYTYEHGAILNKLHTHYNWQLKYTVIYYLLLSSITLAILMHWWDGKPVWMAMRAPNRPISSQNRRSVSLSSLPAFAGALRPTKSGIWYFLIKNLLRVRFFDQLSSVCNKDMHLTKTRR